MVVGIKLGGAQILGKREEQQDAIAFSDKEDREFVEHGGILAVVADGIGGHAYGGDASRRAVMAFRRDYNAKPRMASIPDALNHAMDQANQAVLKFAENKGVSDNCGTTLIATVVHPDSSSLYWCGVGDSRLYFFRNGQVAQFTSDANYGSQLIKKVARGDLSREGLSLEGNHYKLTSYLGIRKLVNIDRSIRPFPLHEGDIVLLCTDGVYQALTKEELLECLLNEPELASEKLVQMVLKKDFENQDNATVAILAYGFIESKRIVLPKTTTINQNNEAESKNEKTKASPTIKIGRSLLWGIIAFGLLILTVLAWLSLKNDNADEENKAGTIRTPVLKQSVEPKKPRPNNVLKTK